MKIADRIREAVASLPDSDVEEFLSDDNPIMWIDINVLSKNNIGFTLGRAEFAEDLIRGHDK